MFVSGTFTSIQMKPKQTGFIHSIDELVKQTDIRWLIEAGSSFVIRGRDAEEGTLLKYDLLRKI